MDGERDRAAEWSRVKGTSDENSTADRTILAIGDVSTWQQAGILSGQSLKIAIAEFADLDSDLLALISPDIILSPMVASGFDCLDLAKLLCSLNFRGRYRIITDQLSRPQVLRDEVRFYCPGLDIDVIVLRTNGQDTIH